MARNSFESDTFWKIAFGLVSSVIISAFFYMLSLKEREPVYAVKKTPSIIFSKNDSSPKIKLLLNDSLIIDSDIYVTTIVFWNAGELEIKKADIRKKFTISAPNNERIIDYKIVSETNPGISKFKILKDGENLTLDWDYFDPGYGVEIQIVYTAIENINHKPPNQPNFDLENIGLKISGSIIGKAIKQIHPKKNSWARYISIIMIFIPVLMYLYFTILSFIDNLSLKIKLKTISSLIFIIALCTLSIYIFGILDPMMPL